MDQLAYQDHPVPLERGVQLEQVDNLVRPDQPDQLDQEV